MKRELIQIKEIQNLFVGFNKIKKFKLTHKLFRGGMSNIISREVVQRGDVVCVIPVDTINDKILLVEQFRIGAYAAEMNSWILEFPAGMHEIVDYPIITAKRELKEETGISEYRYIKQLSDRILISPGFTDEAVVYFLVDVHLDDSMNKQVHGLESEGEDIRLHVLTLEEMSNIIGLGKTNNLMTITGYHLMLKSYEFFKTYNRELERLNKYE